MHERFGYALGAFFSPGFYRWCCLTHFVVSEMWRLCTLSLSAHWGLPLVRYIARTCVPLAPECLNTCFLDLWVSAHVFLWLFGSHICVPLSAWVLTHVFLRIKGVRTHVPWDHRCSHIFPDRVLTYMFPSCCRLRFWEPGCIAQCCVPVCPESQLWWGKPELQGSSNEFEFTEFELMSLFRVQPTTQMCKPAVWVWGCIHSISSLPVFTHSQCCLRELLGSTSLGISVLSLSRCLGLQFKTLGKWQPANKIIRLILEHFAIASSS